MTNDRVRATSRRVSGHTVIDLTSDRLALVLAPQLGGRVLSLQLDGREFLYRSNDLLDDECGARDAAAVGPHDGDMASWRNWGGDKTWPAPQGWSGPDEWAGPPDPVLDSGSYTADITEAPDGRQASVTLSSGPDPRTGLQLARKITLTEGRTEYRLELTGTNITDQTVRWALWNITQLPGHPGEKEGDGVWVGLDDATPGPDLTGLPVATQLVAGTGTPKVENYGRQVAHVPAQEVVGKTGFPRASGWIAHVGRAGTWVHRFPVTPDATYPDDGSRAEVWLEHPLAQPLEHLGGLRPTHRIVECEVLGPHAELAPGEFMHLDTTVQLGPHGGAVTDVGPWGWWNQQMQADRIQSGNGVQLTGRLVPCADAGTPLTVSVTDHRTQPPRVRTHRTQIPIRAGEVIDLQHVAPLPGVPGDAVIAVHLGETDDVPTAGSLLCP
ncbi:DUF4380 domain-containing protein [Streptomyces sp. NPDC055134]